MEKKINITKGKTQNGALPYIKINGQKKVYNVKTKKYEI